MTPLDRHRWKAISAHLDRAFDLPEDELAAWLSTLKASDPELAADLESWCAEHRLLLRDNFLEQSPSKALPRKGLEGETFGNYTLDALIGVGGMGTVWRAHRSDGRFESKAAVKVLNAALVGRSGEQRFSREGNFLARLTHPHIARLIDAGVTASGQPYLVLEYVEGIAIDRYANQHHLSVESRLRLFLDVLSAVAHAHANLIVHRDIKPSNVLVSTDGVVKLLDFGIATLLDSEGEQRNPTVLTRDGGLALTLQYASPEQVTRGPVTTATDIYALGVLLYTLLSGRHPTGDANSTAELIRRIVEVEPPLLGGTLRTDLDIILSKALKKDPRERYSAVTSFADDLRRYLQYQPIGARPDTVAYRTTKFVRRHRASMGLAAMAIVAMIAGFVGTITQARRARAQLDFALHQLSRAEAINDLNQMVLSDAAPSGKAYTVRELLAHAEQIVESQPEDANEDRVEMLLAIGRQYQMLEDHDKARRVLSSAYDTAQSASDQATRIKAGCALAGALALTGDGERAEVHILEAEKALPADPYMALTRIYCLMRGSEVALTRHDLPLAIERIERAKQLAAASPVVSPLMHLGLSMSLAETYRAADRVGDAAAAFRDASARLTSLGREHTAMGGALLASWAMTLGEQGQPLEAERLLRRAIAIGGSGLATETVPPMLLTNLAGVLADTGRLAEATDLAERGYARARAVGDERAVRQSMLLRASLYRQAGNLTRSAAVLSEVEPLVNTSLPAGRSEFASLLSERSMLARAQGKLEDALALADRALLSAEGDTPRVAFATRLLLRRAEVLLDLRQPEKAADDAARAIAMEMSTARDVRSRAIGLAWLTLGRARQAQGRTAEAQTAFASALDHLRSSLGDDHPDTKAARQLARNVARQS